MFVVFIDESGTPNLKDKESKFYVLAAVVMKDPGLNYLHSECERVKQEIWEILREKDDSINFPNKFEIHMDHINGRRGFFKNLKNDVNDWFNVVVKVYDLISRLYVKIICTIIVKEDFKKEGRENVEKWAFELLVEKVNRYIESEGEEDHGLLVMDSVDVETDIKKRKQIIEFLEIGTGHGWDEYPESLSWRVLKVILHNKEENSEEDVEILQEVEQNWRDFLEDRTNNVSTSHYLIHTVCIINYMEDLKKSWKKFTERAIGFGYDNYDNVDFIWIQIPYYFIISPVNLPKLYGYELCEIKEKGIYEEFVAVNLEKFDFIGFIFSKLDQFNQEIRESNSFKRKEE